MYLGIDIGTTSICAVVIDQSGAVVFTRTKANDSHITGIGLEKIQNPERIYEICYALYNEATSLYTVKCVGVTGQMHGMVYVDVKGVAVSSLYSWQDGRGNLPYKGSTYASVLSEICGKSVATGYGSVSLFYDTVNHSIPSSAAKFCTIGDYVAMRLSNRAQPLVHETNAASMGLFDVKDHEWNFSAIEKAGLPRSLFPETVSSLPELGVSNNGAVVYTAVGDNQASVYGAVQSDDTVLINIGTGSQVSVISHSAKETSSEIEIRPYFDGKFLALGCGLCGGHSYKLLKEFFNSIPGASVSYETMNQWAIEAMNAENPTLSPKFRGTRANPNDTASILNLTEQNFNVKNLTAATLYGMVGELKVFYDIIIDGSAAPTNLVGSGNAIRLNSALKTIIEKLFNLPILVPKHSEEAAFGAALLAAEKTENKRLSSFIKYE